MANTAPGITMSITGLDELLKAFDALGQFGTRAALQDAMKKGAEVTAEAARRLAPVGDGLKPGKLKIPRTHLRDSIKVMANLSRSQKRRRGGRRHQAEIFVGSTSPHAHLVEFGHVLVKAKRADLATRETFFRQVRRHRTGELELVPVRGRLSRKILYKTNIGHVPAHPFMRPAFDATKERATRIIFEELGASMMKVAERYRRQAERGKLTRGSREAFRMELGL